MARISQARLSKVESELLRIGLLFEHDREHPSFTGIAAGAPIAGSWWSHALAHPIYDAIKELSERVLSAKLVNGKVTYVHERLLDPFFTAATVGAEQRLDGLSELERVLYARVQQEGSLRADELAAADVAAPRELSAAMAKLAARLLVQTDSVHTDTGAHARVIQSWRYVWKERSWKAPRSGDLDAARHLLEAAALVLTRSTGRPPRLPWRR